MYDIIAIERGFRIWLYVYFRQVRHQLKKMKSNLQPSVALTDT